MLRTSDADHLEELMTWRSSSATTGGGGDGGTGQGGGGGGGESWRRGDVVIKEGSAFADLWQ